MVDITRSGITFSNSEADDEANTPPTLGIQNMITALKRIRKDPSVVVLQAKNRISDEYDALMSGGYRNLSLSLVVVDNITMAKNVDAHICELQLGLAEIDRLKKEEGHMRYVSFRDMLGE